MIRAPLGLAVPRFLGAIPTAALALATLALLTSLLPARAEAGTNVLPKETEFLWRAPGYVPDELLVKFREGAGESRGAQAIQESGMVSRKTLTPDGLVLMKIPQGTSVSQAIDLMAVYPDVEYAAPNLYASGFFVPTDSLIGRFDLAWNLRSVGAYDAWDVVTGSPDIVLAIVDTGVAFENHPVPDYEKPILAQGVSTYLRSPELTGPILPGYDFVNEDDHPNDDNGHGTMVATIATGAPNNFFGSAGIAFGVTILPIKVLDWQTAGTMANIVQGIRYAADQGAHIANLSLGFPSGRQLRERGVSEKDLAAVFNPLRDAVNYAQRRGTILVAAAGNFEYPELSAPAAYRGVISVAATRVDDQRASYSSYGNGLDFVAPGGDFLDQNEDHVQDAVMVFGIKRGFAGFAKPDSFNVSPWFGTSGATPHVSGAVALLMSLGIRDLGSIEQTLRATAVHPVGNANAYDPEYGYGLLRVDRAVRLAAEKLRPKQLAGAAPSGIDARIRTANPSRGGATLALRTSKAGEVRVRLFDVRGALVRTLEEGPVPAGERLIRWDGADDRGSPVGSGIYFFRIESQDGVATRRIALLR